VIKTVKIDSFPESAFKYTGGYAIVAVDILRASTTLTTALSIGSRVFPVSSEAMAFSRAGACESPMLVGEVGGKLPFGFHMNNSPVQVAERMDSGRPVILLSSSGTTLMVNAESGSPLYIGSLRNLSAMAEHLDALHNRVVFIGAGTRGQFRREDQIGCALIASILIDLGFVAEDSQTEEIILQWKDIDMDCIRYGRSADYLRHSGQEEDLEFTLSHIDDLDIIPVMERGEVSNFKI